MSISVKIPSAMVVLGLLVAAAVQAQPPSTFVPGPNGSAAAPTAAQDTDLSTSATAASPQAPARFGVTLMQNDPESRAVLGGNTVGNMTYHSGPVQHTQKVFTIFWNPSGPTFPSGYQTTINQFVQDLNGTPYYAIASQYSDTVSNISTVIQWGGTWLDITNAFPHPAPTGNDLLAEVNRAMTANGWTSDANSYFQIYTPSGVSNGDVSGICGLHYFSNPAFGQILFPQAGCFPGAPYPNSSTVDAAINVSAHEIMETVTDPMGSAWYYVNTGGEIGDLCNFQFGTRDSVDGSNVTLGGHKYVIQQEWSNAVSGCALSYGGGPTTLIAPSGNAGTTTPTYTWNKVGASWYYLWVNDGSGTPVIQTWYTSASVCGSTTCSVTPAFAITAGVTYTWWVQTYYDPGAVYGPWSGSLSFTAGPPPAITLISPTGNIGTRTPTYTWNSVNSATWYYLWVNNASGTAVIQTWYTSASVCGSTTCSVTPAVTLAAGNMHTWWVQTWNPVGYGPWSASLTFTPTLPPAATLISPTGSIGTQTPTYTWTRVSSATWYYLWVNNASGTAVIQTWYTSASVCGSTTCSVTPAVTLATGNTHTWWVQTWNPAGYGPWSAPLTFTP